MNSVLLRRTPRERVLILFFLFAASVVWLLSAGGRLREKWRDARVTAADLAAQDLWLERRASIEERALRAAGSLDAARTLDSTRLVGEISAIATRLGLSAAVESPRTERTEQLAYHTVQVAFQRADLAALVEFYRELGQRAPYLALETCRLEVSSRNSGEIDAVFSIFSVEVERPGGAPVSAFHPTNRHATKPTVAMSGENRRSTQTLKARSENGRTARERPRVKREKALRPRVF